MHELQAFKPGPSAINPLILSLLAPLAWSQTPLAVVAISRRFMSSVIHRQLVPASTSTGNPLEMPLCTYICVSALMRWAFDTGFGGCFNGLPGASGGCANVRRTCALHVWQKSCHLSRLLASVVQTLNPKP